MPIFRPTPLVAALAALYLPVSAQAETPAPGSMTVTADQMDGQMDTQLKARGNVVATRDDQVIEADWLHYNAARDEQVLAGDKVRMRKPGADIRSRELEYFLGRKQGTAQQADFRFTQGRAALQGTGDQLEIVADKHYQLKKAVVNTCDPGDDSWFLRASTIDADYNRSVGVARNARLEIGGVPVMYTPWVDFPLDGGRKSGFLFPSFTTGSDGFDLTVPYYWNIAPNYDATISPRYIDQRGLMLGLEFRYLQPGYNGTVYTEQLPNDKKSDRSRYLWKGYHQQQLTEQMSWGYDATYVSDDDYFRDLGDRASSSGSSNLLRKSWVNYNLGWASAALNVERYQTLQNSTHSVDIPYAKLPQLTLSSSRALGQGFGFNLTSDWTRFSHPSKQEGNRLVLYPSVNWSFDQPWGYIKPKFGVHYTRYDLDALGSTQATTETRSLPITTVDSGLYFERETQFAGHEHTQTLEPRFYYVYIPSRDQSKLPNFDTSQNDFDWAQMFNENRYSGYDRINAANQVTAALTSRYIDNVSGLERLRVGVGQRFYLSDDEVTLAGNQDKRKESNSDILATVGGDLTRDWRLDGSYQFNQELSKTERYTATVRYNPQPGKTLALRYYYSRYEDLGYAEKGATSNKFGPQRQVDVSGQWPLTQHVYGVFRYNYSLQEQQSFESLAGIEYNQGCWGFRIVGQRYLSDVETYKNKVMFQLELKDLSSVGTGVQNTLRLAIPGYSSNVMDKP